jgi:transposase InsO family protein
MLSEHDFAAWALRNGISEAARSAISHIRRSKPSRRVGGGRMNVAGRYPSRKMGVTIQFESHRVELPTIFELEHDPALLEYYDQVPAIKLDYRSADGKRLGVLHTPDFFVIRTDSAGWVECKTEEELNRLTERNSNRYCREGQRWTCPPGHRYAEAMGLCYEVRSSAAINWVFQRNIQFLEDYLRNTPEIPALQKQRVKALLMAQPGCSLDELLRSAHVQLTRDDIYTLIATGDIYVDLRSCGLLEPDKVLVWADRPHDASVSSVAPSETPRPGIQHSLGSEIQHRLLLASEADLAEATRRFQIVSRALRGDSHVSAPSRTLRRWIAAWRTAEELNGNGYIGLLPRPNHGNPAAKLPEKTRSMMSEFIDKDYETLKQKTMYASWSALKLACDREQVASPSFKSFSVAVHKHSGAEQTLKRQGNRAAYQVQPFFWELEQRTPRHGDRPFEIAHIDHTQADVWMVCSQTGRVLGRPWLTFLTDSFSRRVLALYLTFDPPSYRSCMMILRECVRRHARLPQVLVLDGGREFESIYFETLLARCEITKKTRPPAKARFGSTCERLFGTANKQFLHNLTGNTQAARRAREMTKSVDPRNHAAWTITDLHRMLTEYAYEVYDTLDHPALGQTPREAFESATALTGNRAHRTIAYDRDFLILTLPTTRKGTAKVTAGRGMKINHLYYWSEHFRNPSWEAKQVPIRYDPFDIGVAFAFVDRQWVECHSEHYASLHGHSEREVHLASEELRRRRQNHSGQFAVTAKKLAEFLESVELTEEILVQRLSDLEARSLHARPELSGAPVAAAVQAPHSDKALPPIPIEPIPTFVTYGEL